MMHINKPAYVYSSTCRWDRCAGCAPDAWLTGPSKNGADINRLGRSHVSVYTGRPRSSTTRALDSLCTANLHTIHLCLIQKHFIHTQHTRGMGMHIQHMCNYAEMQPFPFKTCKNPNVTSTHGLTLSFSYAVLRLFYLLPLTFIIQSLFLLLLFVSFLVSLLDPTGLLHFLQTVRALAVWQSSHKPIKPVLNSVLQHYSKDSQKL